MSFGGYLKADLETIVTIGPVVAVGDGFTPVTNLAINTADEAEIIKHNATTVTDISAYTFAAIANADGYYALTIAAGALDTEGRLTVLINDDSLCLPVRMDFEVVNANVYDSMFAVAATDYLDVNVLTQANIDFGATQKASITAAVPTAAAIVNEWESQSQVDPTGFHVNVKEVNGTAQTANDMSGDIDDILVDTAVIGALGAGLTAITDKTDNIPAAPATEAKQDTAQADLDTITGTGGVLVGTDVMDRSGTLTVAASVTSPNVLLAAEVDVVNTQTEFTLATGSGVNDAYNDQAIVLYDDSDSDYPSVRTILDYVGATKTVTINAAPDFTLGADDSIRIFATAPGSTPPTAAAIVNEWESQSQIDPTGFHVNVMEVNGTAQTANDNGADINDILTDTGSTLDTLIKDIPTNTEMATIEAAIIAEVDANETKIDTVDTVVDGIQTDLDNTTDGLGALRTLIKRLSGIWG